MGTDIPKFLGRTALLGTAAKTLPYEIVPIPALGGAFVVQGMSGKDRDSFESSLVSGRGKRRDVDTTNIRAKLVVRSLYDAPGGARLFTDEDADLIADTRADILSPIFNVAQKLSGISDEDIEEMGKSSSATTSDTSASASLSS